MRTLNDLEALDAACDLVAAWGRAYYEAAYADRPISLLEVGGEDLVDATQRWIDLAGPALGVAAIGPFGTAAAGVLHAQEQLGRADRAAAADPVFDAGVVVGEARARLEFAETAFRDASKPRALRD